MACSKGSRRRRHQGPEGRCLEPISKSAKIAALGANDWDFIPKEARDAYMNAIERVALAKLTIRTGASRGSDQCAAEVALALGTKVELVLPHNKWGNGVGGPDVQGLPGSVYCRSLPTHDASPLGGVGPGVYGTGAQEDDRSVTDLFVPPAVTGRHASAQFFASVRSGGAIVGAFIR